MSTAHRTAQRQRRLSKRGKYCTKCGMEASDLESVKVRGVGFLQVCGPCRSKSVQSQVDPRVMDPVGAVERRPM